MAILVIESATQLSYFNPCETTKLIAAHGDFTVTDDVAKVNATLEVMGTAKADYYREHGDFTLARAMTVYVRRFAPHAGARPAPLAGAAAVEALKQRFLWRDDETEAAWMKETGWNLLKLACASDDLASVTHLLLQPDAKATMEQKNKPMVLGTELRRQPFSMLLGGSLDQFDAVTCAAAFGSPPVLQALIAAGSRVALCAPCGVMGCWNEGGCRSGLIENVTTLLDAKPSLAAAKDAKGSLPITYALQAPKHCQAELIQLFLERGQIALGGNEQRLKTALNKRDMLGLRPVDYLMINPDADPKAISIMQAAGASVDHKVKLSGVIKLMFWVMSKVGGIKGGGMKRNPLFTYSGKTPAHILADAGNVRMVEGFLGTKEVDTAKIRDKDGSTPVQKLTKTHGDTAVPTLIARTLAAATVSSGKANFPTKQAQVSDQASVEVVRA